jgi:hypothetical protein
LAQHPRLAGMKTLIYLAAPYSHDNPLVREGRFQQINKAASTLMKAGLHIFSPISHTHPIALAGGLPTGWDFWCAYDTAMLEACFAFVVLTLPGWDTSKGVAEETKIAQRLRLQHWRINLVNVAQFPEFLKGNTK